MPPHREIVDIDLGNGMVVPVEVTVEPTADPTGEGRGDVGLRDWWADGRRVLLDRTAPTITGMARWVHDQVGRIDGLKPDRVGVEMGVKFVVRTPDLVMPVLGQVRGETTLLLRLEWDLNRRGDRRPSPSPVESEGDDQALPSGEDS